MDLPDGCGNILRPASLQLWLLLRGLSTLVLLLSSAPLDFFNLDLSVARSFGEGLLEVCLLS